MLVCNTADEHCGFSGVGGGKPQSSQISQTYLTTEAFCHGTPVRRFWNTSVLWNSLRKTATLVDVAWSLELNPKHFHFDFVITEYELWQAI